MSESQVTKTSDWQEVRWTWTSTYPDFGEYGHEIVWERGSHELLYGTKAPKSETNPFPQMRLMAMRNPERFGFDGTLTGAEAAVTAFFAAAAAENA